jgi:hypothetical protein
LESSKIRALLFAIQVFVWWRKLDLKFRTRHLVAFFRPVEKKGKDDVPSEESCSVVIGEGHAALLRAHEIPSETSRRSV